MSLCFKSYIRITVRTYARWSHRRPLKILSSDQRDGSVSVSLKNEKIKTETLPEENMVKRQFKHKLLKYATMDYKSQYNDSNQNLIDLDKIDAQRNEALPKKNITVASKKKSVDMLETVIDENGNFIYTKMKDNDSRISSLMTTVKSRKKKEKNDLILLEGKRLIKDALQNGCRLKYLIFSRKNEVEFLKPYLPKIGSLIYKMPYSEMQMWSDLTTCPGIMGIFKTPGVEKNDPPENSIPLTVICDNIRESGNLGAILRSCAGVGCEKVLLTKGCVNLWDTKVTRSSSGAHFKLQIHQKLDWNSINKLINPESRFLIADNKTTDLDSTNSLPIVPYYSYDFKNVNFPLVLIIGGETEGISEECYQFGKLFNGVRLNIPLQNGIDSLNTGTSLGIILFEIRRQLIQDEYKFRKECAM